MNTAADPAALPSFAFDNSYARELEGLYIRWQPAPAPEPRMAYFNGALATELGLPGLDSTAGTAMLAGNHVPAGADPIAQAYAGHQFGGWSPRLGDGRALLLGEVMDSQGQRRDLAFKGSGRTPFSRGGDGKAALGPMLREVLISEALHALGIPTTRALAVVATGERVLRDSGPLPGAVLTRVAASHLRVGTFQYAAAQDDLPLLQRLLAYAIQRHDPVRGLGDDPERGLSDDPALAQHEQPALALLQAVADKQARLIAQWMGVGFIHGVMNTDNMTISGETIDYGPCAFMDRYDPATVFSSIDHHGRYAYGNQPAIARWNLARLAESLLPLLDADPQRAVDAATRVIDAFPLRYEAQWLATMQAKLGLRAGGPVDPALDAADSTLARDFLASMQGQGVDYTLAFRRLADVAETGNAAALRALYTDATALDTWLPRWQRRLAEAESTPLSGGSAALNAEGAALRAAAMRRVNPWVIARNQRVDEALNAASDDGDMTPFNWLLALLRQPYTPPANAADLQAYTHPAAAELSTSFQTFCGT